MRAQDEVLGEQGKMNPSPRERHAAYILMTCVAIGLRRSCAEV